MSALKEIHNLIISLEKSEKKFIKSRLNKIDGGDTNYHQLYNIIASHSIFSREKIYQRITARHLEKNINYLQNYLYEFLLESIRMHRKEKDIHLYVKTRIHDSKYLREVKGLHKQALKRVQQAYKMAKKYEFFSLEKECIGQMIALSFLISTDKSTLRNRDYLHQENKIISKRKALFERLITEIGTILNWVSQGDNRRKTEEKEKYEIICDGFSKEEMDMIADSFRLKRRYLLLSLLRNNLLGNFDKNVAASNDILDLTMSNTAITDYYPSFYVNAHINRCSVLISIQEWEQIPFHLDCIKNAPKKYPQINLPNFEKSYLAIYKEIHFVYFLLKKDFEEAEKAALIFEEALQKRSDKTSPVYFEKASTLAFGLWKLGDWSKMSYWTNHLLTLSLTKVCNQKLYAQLKMIEITYHYHQEDFEIIPSLLLSLERYLKKNERLFLLEKWFISIFKNNKAYTSSKKQIFFQEKEGEFIQIIQDPYEKMEAETLPWTFWLKSIINKSSISAEILRAKD